MIANMRDQGTDAVTPVRTVCIIITSLTCTRVYIEAACPNLLNCHGTTVTVRCTNQRTIETVHGTCRAVQLDY